MRNAPRLVTQKELDESIAGWKADPAAMRQKILATATDTHSLLMAMMMATQEQAAANSMMRGEPCVVISEEQFECFACEQSITGMPHQHNAPRHLKIFRNGVWMGEPTRWVCELCMAPMPIKLTPDMERLRREHIAG